MSVSSAASAIPEDLRYERALNDERGLIKLTLVPRCERATRTERAGEAARERRVGESEGRSPLDKN